MMQSRTSCAIILPEITCYLHPDLSEMSLIVQGDEKEASVKQLKCGGHKLEIKSAKIG